MSLKIERRDETVGVWNGSRAIVWTSDTVDALERLCTGTLPAGSPVGEADAATTVTPEEAPTMPQLPVFPED